MGQHWLVQLIRDSSSRILDASSVAAAVSLTVPRCPTCPDCRPQLSCPSSCTPDSRAEWGPLLCAICLVIGFLAGVTIQFLLGTVIRVLRPRANFSSVPAEADEDLTGFVRAQAHALRDRRHGGSPLW
jgi:hypothetical protein